MLLTIAINTVMVLSSGAIALSMFHAHEYIDADPALQLRMAMPMMIGLALISLRILLSKNRWKVTKEITRYTFFLAALILGLRGVQDLVAILLGETSQASFLWALITTTAGISIALLLRDDSV